MSINIANDSALSEHILTDRFEKRNVMFREEFLYQFLTGVPKLLTVEKGRLEYIIFSHHQKDGPAVLFYDLHAKCEVMCVKNAEFFMWSIAP